MAQVFTETLQQLTAKVGESVREIRKEDSLVFLTFSDLHTKAVESEFVQKLLLALKTADSEISPDFVINLGDNTGMLVADSCQCLAKPITILSSNYPPIKINLKINKNFFILR